MNNPNWFHVFDNKSLISPSLLVYPDRIDSNIIKMLLTVSDVNLLRPHIKTHKTAEIIKMQMDKGIKKFKCATIAEAELLAQCNVNDILLAMPLVGADIDRFVQLMSTYTNSHFSTLIDNELQVEVLAEIAVENQIKIALWMDINCGMNRTGILPNKSAAVLFKQLVENPNLTAMGFHVYDGHIRNAEIEERTTECDLAFSKVLRLKEALEKQGISVPAIIAGGSPSFPIHANRGNVDVSPGTAVLWDAGYGKLLKDMKFKCAAVLFTRIISKPAPNVLCFDLGHKSIAPEMDFPKVHFLNLPQSKQIRQSEEHLVVEVADSDLYNVGDGFYAIPMHICPTVAKYEYLQVVEDNVITGQWHVAARNQKITI